ncbi:MULTISPECIES: hypothetical protein [Nostocales]|uniref:Ketol-acid reductoisomerase n=3 Tax=Nostocales TaxID=1161 RepID=A0A0C1N8Z0_9CYAN|nr:hypothetical protein [Tolypothrix bouteillei]KAF3885231.1 hypothetical protein DA73_0400006985 [Tolypothrix bouteillei VB521301]
MDRKTATGFLLILFLIFVGFGDSFLPKPLSSTSLNTRTTINKWVIGLFPSWRPKTNPNQRTEKAIEETEKGFKNGGK